ncbi:MAG TPA: tetratricopeptide repeat protein, partial [Chloroflexia bacterium]
EASTGRWEAHPDLMPAAFARQEAILRAAIAAQEGWAYKQIGDAFQAAFQTAPAALVAALAAQRALAAEPWPEAIGPLRVRMALHTGVAEERADDYVGPPLYRAHRLLSAGHGGQILLTAATYQLVRDALPGEVGLLDLGEHRLKDLIRPEHIWQVTPTGHADAFPPLKTLDARSHNLPVQPTPLIGRETELAAVAQLLRRPAVRLVTLTGAGGTGKTRLALQAAADRLEDLPDGAWFVNLAPLSDPALVPSAIATALDVREAPGRSLLQAVQDYLRDKRLLLVLDNFEQILVAASVVAELLAGVAGLQVLVTSRAPLHLRGEHEFPVPPLALPPGAAAPTVEGLGQYAAVRLFIASALAVKPDFTVTNATAPAVAEICARLDGLPLAIELAAARSKLLGPEALLARLERRLPLLTGGARDLPTRQQTLRAAIAWSYDLLDAEEQRLFRRLAVFQGGATITAIAAVCNADRDVALDVLDSVGSLVDKSLLRQETAAGSEPRFGMLETIHEYARERLGESGEEPALQKLHARFFLALAEATQPSYYNIRWREKLDRVEADYDNIRAALDWALEDASHEQTAIRKAELALRLAGALPTFWMSRGHLGEGRRWLERALAHSTALESIAARAKALTGAGSLAGLCGDNEQAIKHLEEALRLYDQLGDKSGMVDVLLYLGNARVGGGDLASQRALYEQSLALSRELDKKPGIAASLNNLAALAQREGDYQRARPLYEESLALGRALEFSEISVTLCHLGQIAHREGDYQAAGGYFREALLTARQAQDSLRFGLGLDGLAGIAGAMGQLARAARLYGAVDALHSAIGFTLQGVNRVEHERNLAAARAQLDAANWAASYSAGQAMALDEAVAYALEEPVED